ncbi:IS481 family transposase [Polaromonas sp. SM01]|uniref:IS481 family transposase n=1 Tax=Polaromonas sp. SM01 TaxID=3085630 RepID=UPI002980B8D6|nr:IS481 family transposase [Polaromonas sp. SM01]MDW5444384.1 IS481 family transposase [Polaromonas sp. SM01]
MPWNTRDTMSLREDFITLAQHEGANRRELCRRFGISPQTGYKWLARFAQQGPAGLCDASRRPLHSPGTTQESLQQAVLTLRREHPAWGGRKIARRLQDLGLGLLAPSTVTAILHRHGLISVQASTAAQPWQRFEHEHPNALWQIDFKGYVDTPAGRCHPLTLLDDHSRFNMALRACAKQEGATVRGQLTEVFRSYGLPVRINADNGAPWGSPREPGQVSELALWLIRLGIRVSFSRPYHPQTNGKDERFHRSLKAEVLNGRSFTDLNQAQAAFDRWREVYNHQRPHQALGMATPASRYRMSERSYPQELAPIEYGPQDTVVIVKALGEMRFKEKRYELSSALRGMPVAVRAISEHDGRYGVYFMHHKLREIDLREE